MSKSLANRVGDLFSQSTGAFGGKTDGLGLDGVTIEEQIVLYYLKNGSSVLYLC